MRSFAVVLVCSVSAGLLLGCDLAPSTVDASALDVSTSDAGFVADAPEVPDASAPGPDASSESPDAWTETPDAFVTADVAPVHCDVDAGGEAPTFRALYTDVFETHGCPECHVPGLHWSPLDLSSVETAYENLIGVMGCDDVTPRVTPCDPSASTLSIVPGLRAEPCGGRHTHSSPTYTGILSEEGRARVDAWIASGAAF